MALLPGFLHPLSGGVPGQPQVRCDLFARGLQREVLGKDAILDEADHPTLRLLVKFLLHTPNFPIYSVGTNPGAIPLRLAIVYWIERSYHRRRCRQDRLGKLTPVEFEAVHAAANKHAA